MNKKGQGLLYCPECNNELKKIAVSVEGAKHKVISYQCPKCGYFEFDKESGLEVVKEIRQKSISPLNIKQKIIKISHDRLGTYFNENIIRSAKLKAGKEVYVSVPDKKHIIMTLSD